MRKEPDSNEIPMILELKKVFKSWTSLGGEETDVLDLWFVTSLRGRQPQIGPFGVEILKQPPRWVGGFAKLPMDLEVSAFGLRNIENLRGIQVGSFEMLVKITKTHKFTTNRIHTVMQRYHIIVPGPGWLCLSSSGPRIIGDLKRKRERKWNRDLDWSLLSDLKTWRPKNGLSALTCCRKDSVLAQLSIVLRSTRSKVSLAAACPPLASRSDMNSTGVGGWNGLVVTLSCYTVSIYFIRDVEADKISVYISVNFTCLHSCELTFECQAVKRCIASHLGIWTLYIIYNIV